MAKIKQTDLATLARMFAPDLVAISARVLKTDMRSVRACMKAALVDVVGASLQLTPRGIEAVKATREGKAWAPPAQPFTFKGKQLRGEETPAFQVTMVTAKGEKIATVYSSGTGGCASFHWSTDDKQARVDATMWMFAAAERLLGEPLSDFMRSLDECALVVVPAALDGAL